MRTNLYKTQQMKSGIWTWYPVKEKRPHKKALDLNSLLLHILLALQIQHNPKQNWESSPIPILPKRPVHFACTLFPILLSSLWSKVKVTLNSPFTMYPNLLSKTVFFLCSVDSICPLFEDYKDLTDNSTSSLLQPPSCHMFICTQQVPCTRHMYHAQWWSSDKALKGNKHHLELIIFLPCPKSLKGSSLHTELSSKFSGSNTSPLWF